MLGFILAILVPVSVFVGVCLSAVLVDVYMSVWRAVLTERLDTQGDQRQANHEFHAERKAVRNGQLKHEHSDTSQK